MSKRITIFLGVGVILAGLGIFLGKDDPMGTLGSLNPIALLLFLLGPAYMIGSLGEYKVGFEAKVYPGLLYSLGFLFGVVVCIVAIGIGAAL